MSLLIGFLTFILVMNCLFLMLVILIQLPKKDAGAGVAFGGAATDALFGAGSGNALTQVTKYSAVLFVALSIGLSILNMNASRQGTRRLEQELSRKASAAAPVLPSLPTTAPQAPTTTAVTPPASTANPAGRVTPEAPASSLMSTTATNQTGVAAPAAPANPTPAPAAPTTPAK